MGNKFENLGNKITFSVLRIVITVISVVIALPTVNSKSYNTFILTMFVLLFGKFIESLENALTTTVTHLKILYGIGCAIGILSLAFCMYYFGVVFDINSMVGQNNTTRVLSDYPLLRGDAVWSLPIITAIYYLFIEIWFVHYLVLKYNNMIDEE